MNSKTINLKIADLNVDTAVASMQETRREKREKITQIAPGSHWSQHGIMTEHDRLLTFARQMAKHPDYGVQQQAKRVLHYCSRG